MNVIDVNEKNFEEEVLKSKKKVLVDFNADWCGPCRMLRPIIEQLSDNEDYKFVSINIDDEENLASKYGVMSIPCLVVFENGKEVKRSVGLIPKNEVEKLLGE